MKSMWLFRSNIRGLEAYHQFKNLDEYKNKCWDFYIMQGIWYLENNYIDEFIVFRLKPKGIKYNQVLNCSLTNGTKFKQIFVDNFEDIFNPSIYQMSTIPLISFFRGGFPEYDKFVSTYKECLGTTLYLGAGRRITPQYGGSYTKILVESENDQKLIPGSIPFYKTCNPNVFNPLKNISQEYDILFPANFTQRSYKGQDCLLQAISDSIDLKKINFVNVGNKPEVGQEICKKFNVTNMRFGGHKERSIINIMLNKSKFGIVCSNNTDGCPRVITEILCSGTPLLIRDETRLLDFYKHSGVVIFNTNNIEEKIIFAMNNYTKLKNEAMGNLENLSMNTICKLNWKLWTGEE